MFIYVVYNVNTLDVCKVFLDEDDVTDFFTSYEVSTCTHLSWKAINIDYFFKSVMDMLK